MALPGPDAGVGHSFGLEIDGVTVGRITEVSGLVLEQDVIEVKQQTPDGRYVIRRLPGRPKPGEVTLTRGLTDDRTFIRWIADVRADSAGRRNGAIVVYDYDGAPVVTYTLTNAWPSKLEVGALKAGDTSYLTERLTLVYESLTVD
jgi:phage tail-like protein